MDIDFSKYINSDEVNDKESDFSKKTSITDDMMKQVVENIKVSEVKRQEIIRMIGKEPLEDTLMKTLECISLMTGDNLFFEVNKDKIKRRD